MLGTSNENTQTAGANAKIQPTVSKTLPVEFDGYSPTERWHALREHAEQVRLWNHPARFKTLPAGRRSGKTEISKRRLVSALIDSVYADTRWTDHRFFAGAPTRDQAKRIWWEDLKALVPREFVAKIEETNLFIRTAWGAELHVIGLDRPQRLEGVSWDGCVIDEFADTKPGAWQANIRPALADRLGWAWLIGVPDRESSNQVLYRELVERAKSGVDPEWAFFHWPGSDILPAGEVEALRQQLDEDTFNQEILGQFILAGGLAFSAFSPANVTTDAVYDPALPLCWSLDFNINPMCSGLIQHAGGKVRVIHEFVLADSDTNTACDAFLEYCEANQINPRGVHVYGDPSGNARDSTSGVSDWAIVRQRLNNIGPVMRVPRAHAPLKDTKNALQARIKNAAGQMNLIVHPSCKNLVKEFGSLLWPSDLSDGHNVAWLRYFCHTEYPIIQFTFPTANQFSV